jgi:8-oxo-dGTP pyrophosphatase MutT (NUDIX family)
MSPEKGEGKNEIHQVVRGILVTIDGFVGIGRRTAGTYEGGKWCLVGGKAEKSDLNSEVLREIQEETGMPNETLTDDRPVFIGSPDRIRKGVTYRNNYFILEIDDEWVPEILKRFERREFDQIAFVTQEDLKGLRFAFGDGKIVRSFFKMVGR